jgi:hypothetical protein
MPPAATGAASRGAIRTTLFVSAILLAATAVSAQGSGDPVPAGTAPASSGQQDERPTGLPPRVKWTFTIDAGWGNFGFANSLHDHPREPIDEDLSDQWFEGFVRPALTAVYALPSSSEIYGKVSVAGERTYGSVPDDFGEDVSSFGPEDLSIGWRSGDALPALGSNALDFVFGRTQYQLGHGLLLFDGAAEGGSRGGYWTNARQAFELAAIGRFKSGAHTVETFYLDKDELKEADTGSRLAGANYEYSFGPESSIGATYMKWRAHAGIVPGRDGLNVFNLRAYVSPLRRTPALSFEAEYAAERNGDALRSNAWNLQGAYELAKVAWKPKFTYRYAFFQGDDPDTAANEAFDPLFQGFHDWGTWWQGEIAGEYFLSNSNLVSHLARVHVSPLDTVSGGLLFFNFFLDKPGSAGPGVTAKELAFETDAYVDWNVNENFTVSFVASYADPRKAGQQINGRTKNFVYGMVYIGYSY